MSSAMASSRTKDDLIVPASNMSWNKQNVSFRKIKSIKKDTILDRSILFSKGINIVI